MDTTKERRIRLYFDISIIGKGIISAAEIVAGLFAFVIPVSVVTGFVGAWAQQELGEEPGDYIATQLDHIAHQLSFASSTFIALYLLSRGLVKLLLIIAMLKNRLWAYPASLALIGAFMAYQCYQIVITHSVLIVLLTLFDFVVVYFIWREYQVLREHAITLIAPR